MPGDGGMERGVSLGWRVEGSAPLRTVFGEGLGASGARAARAPEGNKELSGGSGSPEK